MLEIRGLTKYYRNIPVVNDVSFTLKPGEVTGYLGPNGSGKSTTVKIIGTHRAQRRQSAARWRGYPRRPDRVQATPGLRAGGSYPLFLPDRSRVPATDGLPALHATRGGGAQGQRSAGAVPVAPVPARAHLHGLQGHETAHPDLGRVAA